jgi:hypothetical protein
MRRSFFISSHALLMGVRSVGRAVEVRQGKPRRWDAGDGGLWLVCVNEGIATVAHKYEGTFEVPVRDVRLRLCSMVQVRQRMMRDLILGSVDPSDVFTTADRLADLRASLTSKRDRFAWECAAEDICLMAEDPEWMRVSGWPRGFILTAVDAIQDM